MADTLNDIMPDIKCILDKMVNYELRMASNYATRSTIKMRALMKLLDELQLSLAHIYETKNLIRIDVSCSKAIEELWKKYYGLSSSSNGNIVGKGQQNSTNINNNNSTTTSGSNISSHFPTTDEWATLERFLAKDFARNVDLIRLTAVLKKRLPEKDINFIFAVDGLYYHDNYLNNDLRYYFENLSIPIIFDNNKNNKTITTSISSTTTTTATTNNIEDAEEEEQENIEWIHVKAIRTIYKKFKNTCTPEKIGKVLRKIFELDFNKIVTSINDNLSSSFSTNTNQIEVKNNNENNDHNLSSCSSSNTTSDSENDNDNVENEDNIVENNIETIYKKIVGNKLLNIASWKKMEFEKVVLKEINRKRKSNDVSKTNKGDEEEGHRNKPGRPRIKHLKNNVVKKRRIMRIISSDEEE